MLVDIPRGLFSLALSSFATQTTSAQPSPVHSIAAPRLLPGVVFSDHANYWDARYPAVMITDTAFYRNPNYHSRTGTPETLDYRRMAKAVSGVFSAVLALSR